jgi:hypothetical protein
MQTSVSTSRGIGQHHVSSCGIVAYLVGELQKESRERQGLCDAEWGDLAVHEPPTGTGPAVSCWDQSATLKVTGRQNATRVRLHVRLAVTRVLLWPARLLKGRFPISQSLCPSYFPNAENI